MKKFVAFIKDEENLIYNGSNDVEIEIIGFFLKNDVGLNNLEWCRIWIQDDRLDITGGNYGALYKKDGKIFIGEQFSKEEDGGPHAELTKEQFLDVLDRWEKVLLQDPSEILIIKENNKITFETR